MCDLLVRHYVPSGDMQTCNFLIRRGKMSAVIALEWGHLGNRL